MFTDTKAQQVFLNCIHYLTTHGINTLYDEIEVCTADNISNLGLAKELSPAALKDLLEKLKFRIECTIGQSNFAELVVPVSRVNFEQIVLICLSFRPNLTHRSLTTVQLIWKNC